MRRLDEIIAGLLPGLRAMVVEEEEACGAVEAPQASAARRDAQGGTRAGGTGAHPRSSSRRMAKKATGLDARISMKR